MRKIADDIDMLLKLTTEMNGVCKRLIDAGVKVYVTTRASRVDPLSGDPIIHLEIDLGAETRG